ncbi:MAG: lipopolysaccharide assembly protein LapA domain-containing protein, partial [Steroidobacteraceae bacterium]
GILFGALNDAFISVNFHVSQVHVRTGVALLCALTIGWLLGGLVAWLGHGRMRRELRALRRASPRSQSP